jgi:hypothetical protein
LRNDRGLLSGLHERPRVQELPGEALDEERQVEVLGVLAMEDRQGEGVVEELCVDTVA